MEIKKSKILLKYQNVQEIINFFKKKNENFVIKKTGYTCEIETDKKIYLFSKGLTSKKTFIANFMIKADIEKSNIHFDKIPFNKINYYNFRENFTGGLISEKCACIDISACYPNTLKKLGLITDKTLEYLMKLPKPDRLKCVGMIASNPVFYHIKGGKVDEIKIKESLFSNYFYAVCYDVGIIMNNLFSKYSENCHFFWVDGIFCEYSVVNNIKDELNKIYPITVENILNLRATKTGKFLIYEKDGKNKILPVPQKRLINDERIEDFFNNK
jgi:hypothetical protein